MGGPPAAPVKPAKKKSRVVPAVITGIVALLIGIGIGSAAAGGSAQTAAPGAEPAVTVTETVEKPGGTATVTEKPKPAPTVTVTKTVTQKAEAPAAPEGFGAGTYEVGVDMPAGKYKTKGPDDSGIDSCYWSRNEDASGENIIANALLEGQGVVEINKGEYFETTGCLDWVKQ